MSDMQLVFSFIFLFVLGLLLLFKPFLMWKLEHYFTVRKGEPTALYIAVSRFSGAIFIIASILMFWWFLSMPRQPLL